MLTNEPTFAARELTALGDLLLAVNSVGDTDTLWVSDGSRAGTRPIVDFVRGAGRGVELLTLIDQRVAFTVDDTDAGFEVWVTDGTSQGTRKVTDIPTAPVQEPYSYGLFPFGEDVLVATDAGANERVLWKVDVDTGDRQRLREFGGIRVFDSWLGSRQVTVELNGRVLFQADDGTHGMELWSTDGTPAGTSMVVDLVPEGGRIDAALKLFKGKAYFGASGEGVGLELWSTDGTAEGTQLIADVRPGPKGSDPLSIVASENWLYWQTIPVELSETQFLEPFFQSDGSVGSVNGIPPLIGDPKHTVPSPMMATLGDSLVFWAMTRDPVLIPHEDIWYAPANAFEGKQIWTGDASQFAVIDENLYFLGRPVRRPDGRPSNHEIWTWNPHMSYAVRLTEFPFVNFAPYSPKDLIAVGDQIFFTAGDPVHGRQLYTLADSLDGDLDWDGDVDSADMVLFLEGWTGAQEPGTGNVLCSEGDLDQDQDADSADLLLFLSSWTGAQGASGLRDASTLATTDIGSPAEEPDANAVQPQSVDVAMSQLEIDRLIRPSVID